MGLRFKMKKERFNAGRGINWGNFYLSFIIVLLIFFLVVLPLSFKELTPQLEISYSPPTIDTFPEDYKEYVYETSSGNNLLRVFAGIETAGIHISRASPDSGISYMELYYKPSSSSQWIRGHDFTGQITKTIFSPLPSPTTFTHVPLELYISSLFNLKSGTNYDLRVDFFSSGGLAVGSISLSFVTQPNVFSFTPSRTVIVNPGESIQTAIDGATPGTRILVNPGVYREALSFNSKSGTPKNWIQVIANGAGVVLDGSNSDPQSQIFGSWTKYTNSNAVSGNNMWTTKVPRKYWSIWMRSAGGEHNYLFRHVAVNSITAQTNFLDASSGHNSDGCDDVTSPLNAGNYMPEGWYIDNSNNLFIRLEPGKDPNTLDFKVSEQSKGIDIVNSDWIWIEGFTIRYFGDSEFTRGGVCITNGNNNIIRKNILVPNANGVIISWADDNGNKIADDGGAYNRIEGNKISTKIRTELTTYCKTKKGGGFWGVGMGGSIGNIIRGNEVYSIGENSLQLQMKSSSQVALGCVDLGSYIFGFYCPDLNYFLGFENDFYDNYIHDNVEGLEMDGPHSVNTRLFRNKLENLEMNFISLQSGQFGPTWLVRNLWIRNSSSIYSRGEIFKIRYPAIHRYVYIYHNTLFNQDGQIYSRRDDNLYVKMKIYNNIFHVVSGTVARFYDATSEYLPYKKSPDMDYNSYSSGDNSIAVYDNSYNRVKISQICSIYGIDCHGIMTDALFADSAHENFALSSTSKNIDAGTLIFGINNLYSGIAPDIGAYEYGISIYCDNDGTCDAGEDLSCVDCVVESCDDSDGDSYGVGCYLGDDCNDGDANIHPGAVDICDGIDNDCDGMDNGCGSSSSSSSGGSSSSSGSSGGWGNYCGDNKIGGNEVCDGKALNGKSCANSEYDYGKLRCLVDCFGYDYEGCFNQELTQVKLQEVNVIENAMTETKMYFGRNIIMIINGDEYKGYVSKESSEIIYYLRNERHLLNQSVINKVILDSKEIFFWVKSSDENGVNLLIALDEKLIGGESPRQTHFFLIFVFVLLLITLGEVIYYRLNGEIYKFDKLKNWVKDKFF